jgi:hypothetical protein
VQFHLHQRRLKTELRAAQDSREAHRRRPAAVIRCGKKSCAGQPR